jgi:hypothetical protein
MANLASDLKLLDPSTGTFVQVDTGGISLLLINILIELRVHTHYMKAMNLGLISDSAAQLRLDVCQDPSSLTPFTPTVSS